VALSREAPHAKKPAEEILAGCAQSFGSKGLEARSHEVARLRKTAATLGLDETAHLFKLVVFALSVNIYAYTASV
jgi:hypothetical protein